MKIIFDLEADGLLDECTKIYCLCTYNLETGESRSITDYDEMRILFENPEVTAIGHNIIRFDGPVIEKILGIEIKATLHDTLTLSWYLYPLRDTHNLADWGVDFGVPKPVIDDWFNLPLERYIKRCEEDVKINTCLWNQQFYYLNQIYSEEGIDSILGYLMFKMQCAKEQEDVKWKLDVEKCTSNLEFLESEKDSKRQALVDAMPLEIKTRKMHKPKKPYKQDGSYSAIGERWFALLEERELSEDHEETLDIETARVPGNPNSHQQLKDWLFNLGWEPQTFKYNKESDGSLRKIPQINLPFGQGICVSIKSLYEKEPALENLDKYSVLSHRIGILKGFLRDEKDGYLIAQVKGLTNTLRFQHTELVNLPGVATQYGEYIRSVLIAPEGYVLCGSDMSSLEDRTKQHYMYFFDPGYVESMIKPGFDPHLDLAEFAYNLTKGEMGVSPEDIEFFKNFHNIENPSSGEIVRYKKIKGERHSYKTTNYAAVYGVTSPTLSRNSGLSQDRCEKLLLAYWEKNWSVKKIANSCRVKTVEDQMWLRNPISGFWYTLRFQKDKFSTLNQGKLCSE